MKLKSQLLDLNPCGIVLADRLALGLGNLTAALTALSDEQEKAHDSAFMPSVHYCMSVL